MRIFGLALLTIAAVACAAAVEEPPTSPPPSPDTSTSAAPAATTTTSPEDPGITLMLDPVEALAADDGVRVEISSESGEALGRLHRERPQLETESTPQRLTMRYLGTDGEATDVVWEQTPMAPVTSIRQPWRDSQRCTVTLPDGSDVPVALVWQSGDSSGTYTEQLERAEEEVTVVSPVWWRLAEDGSVVSTADPAYVDTVHGHNVAIWPAVAGFDADTHHLVLSDPARRSEMAARISEEARSIGADGLNIDIEGYRAEDADAFVAWVEELARLVRDWGGVVSHDLIPRSDTWDVSPTELAFWSTAPPRAELSRATDCTVLMAYDQHNRYRPAGPVASPGWVEEVMVHTLRHTDPAQLVLGVPFYGRIWDPADLERPTAVGIGELGRLVSDGETSHDPTHDLDRVELDDGHFFWAETPAGLEHRFDLVDEYGLAGWAGWRFGFDSPEIWDVVADRDP